MFKTLYKVLFALIVIIVIAYFLQNRANTPEACANIDGLWDPVDEVCKSTTEQVIFQSLSKPHPVSVVYPENQRLVKLDKVEQVDEFIFLRGHYEDLLQAADDNNQAIYDRGSVYLNMSKLKLLAKNTTDVTYFAAPFVINTAGKGVFVYVGLFSYDFSSKQATHLSSELLGNRVREENIIVEGHSIVEENVFVQEGLIKVRFKSHGPKQTMSEYPTQSNEILLQLVALDPHDDQNASFRRITKNTVDTPASMHVSWDADGDGLNDCEKDNTCDRSVDYSQEKSMNGTGE
ncbi:hypothetical protein E2R68_09115 [Psychromonas sp. RZ22]|uniref:hypothetical protein n=1 Tax=Psychromonas algarum TaxID=2555643 RepID=UPI001067D135|nr:hypothetical protein [Psychromonas sp. RZ22]TEW54423.1 hypothetical protein E2R68_09115 [Psychromonas sp. RZ22]